MDVPIILRRRLIEMFGFVMIFITISRLIIRKCAFILLYLIFYTTLCNYFMLCTGDSGLVLRPKTTEDVSEILKYCNDRTIAVCPQAGNTSMSGGSVALFDEVVVSTERMNNIINFDPVSGE